MPPEALDHTVTLLERGEVTVIEAIDQLLAEEFTTRKTRRIDVAPRTSCLLPVKTVESFDFSFQPSVDRSRIMTLAEPRFIERREVVVRFCCMDHLRGGFSLTFSDFMISRRRQFWGFQAR